MSHSFKLCRLYFNRRDDPAGCWSVDSGPGTQEIKVRSISLVDIDIAKTREDFIQHPPEGVSAWIELSNVFGSLDGNGHLVLRGA